ncbi:MULTISPECIES: AAA family ATPase [Paenibacillus]|uniref:AAA family ATPase n=1 Tax=Paenibacillus TaxID=44249 RepID=UPI0007BFD255|nr:MULTISPECIES: AAA family ATPase [Paenibacillus]MCZ1267811.1 AAA family ATPase [Paenibacillus tundrae]OAX47772.1 ATP-dependent zinc metalloprotease FtsH [Paenibacillus sp. AD87]SDK65197.1 ATP-dependent metalloprotease FtsH [Paenibacillus sp. OK060]SEA84647.1 ATP-dependent metalloprotease FtsH [Paenibacillus sp. 276b]SLJ90886.1 ATP-dependent metalloprotease FtsH [Paenibacillus sp. RU5A]
MPKWTKEIAIGFVPVLIIFLAFIGVNMIPILIAVMLVGALLLMMQMRGGITVGAGQERKRKKKGPSKLTFEEIGGQESAKQELREALDFLIRHEEIQKFGIRPLKGILLTGPPGTGKTLMAKAAAHYTDSVFVAASGSEFVEMYVGVGAGRIRDLFRDARTRAAKENKENAIIFIDEIDVIGGKREGGQQREYDQTLNQLLTEMDGIYSSETPRILVIAATNRKEMLDSALTRPGRFDRHIQVDLPDKKGRKHILELHAVNKPLLEGVSLDKTAEESYGFSGAQLESVMNEAAIYAMRDGLLNIEQRHLSLAIDKVMMGEKTDRESSVEEKKRVAIHELGHAIMAELVRPGSVSQVALSPRGQALGYVRHNPQQEQFLYTKRFLEEQIMIALGGAAAEEMYYGGRSTGSRNDFEQATNVVQTMMASGLTTLGIVNMDMVTTEELMRENKLILQDLMEQTKRLLEEQRTIFDNSLDTLLREEVLSGDQFRCQFRDSALLPA